MAGKRNPVNTVFSSAGVFYLFDADADLYEQQTERGLRSALKTAAVDNRFIRTIDRDGMYY